MKRTSGMFLVVLFSFLLVVMFSMRGVVAEPFSEGWTKTYGGTSDEWAWSVVETVDGGYAIAGCTQPYGGIGDPDFWLVKIDASGEIPEFAPNIFPVALMITMTLTAVLIKKTRVLRALTAAKSVQKQTSRR